MQLYMNHLNRKITMFKSLVSNLCLVSIVFLLGSQSIYAQGSGTISGTVKDKATGEVLLFANVQLEGTSIGNPTDAEGNYVIRRIP